MRSSEFNEIEFFRAIQRGGTRALLIGRRALVLLGLPVLTADYDFWIAMEDIGRFNESVAEFDLVPTNPPHVARGTGRYVLENDEYVDVLVARSFPADASHVVEFENLWQRRRTIRLAEGVEVQVPAIPDLILTKRIRSRPKDLEDIRLLEILQEEEPE